MTRLEKKCLVTSASAHALLFALLFVPPLLFVSKPQLITLPLLDFIPSRLVDGAMSRGGSPDAKSEPAPAKPAPARAQAVVLPPPKPQAAPKEETKPAKEESTPKPPKRSATPAPADKKTPKTKPDDDPDEMVVGKRKYRLDLTRAASSESASGESRAQAQANARAAAQAQYVDKLNSVLGAIGRGISSGTSIDVPGPGGEAFADYKQFVFLKYKQAWIVPSDLMNDTETVKVRVVIRRSGKVESFKIIKKSGNTALDQSVGRLEYLREIAPFPEGAREETRAFIINFNLLL